MIRLLIGIMVQIEMSCQHEEADKIDVYCIRKNVPLKHIFEEIIGEFPRGVGHRVENGWGLTKVAVV